MEGRPPGCPSDVLEERGDCERDTAAGGAGGPQALRRGARPARGRLPRESGGGHGPGRRQWRRQDRDDQVHRRHLPGRRGRDPVGRPAGQHPRAQGLRPAGYRGRLPGPRAVRQPRRRPEHVPGPREAVELPSPRRGADGEARPRDARRSVGQDADLGATGRGRPVRRPAPVDRRRQGRALEQQARHPRRADGRARRGPDPPGPRPRQAAGSERPGGRPDLPQHARRLRGRRLHLGPAPRRRRRRVQDNGDDPARDRRGDHRGAPKDGARHVRGRAGGDRVTTPTPATPPVQTPEDAGAVEAPLGPQTLGGAARDWWVGVRNGELGVLPIIVGIVIIAIYFQARNDHFLTAGNFVNLIAQMSAVTIIAMGIVFVLLLGEIDLSVGYLSGIGGVVAAVLLRPDGSQWSTAPALIAAIGVCTAIGLFQGFWFARVGVPSFVVTLAGLLAWNGVVLQIIGSKGTIVIQDKVINGLANDYMSHTLAWGVLLVSIGAFTAQQVLTVFRRRQAGLPNRPWSLIGLRIAVLAAAGIFVVEWADTDRGIPYVGLLMLVLYVFWTFIAQRTKFGRYVYAVGGNAEAARRAGINVTAIRIAVFGISGTMAAIGGIVLASRLSSVDTSTGSGSILLYSIAAAVIGGTSLFGGRGTVASAVLGGIVIGMVANGLGLLNVSVGTQYIVTGVVLLAAATLDSLSRRKSAASGRA